MNLPPATVLLIVFIAAVANLLVLLAVSARARAGRAKHVEVEGFMSSSYGKDGTDLDQVPTSTDGRTSTTDVSTPTRRYPWANGNAWSSPVYVSAGSGVPLPAEPLEYPAPSALEQRSVSLDAAEADALAEAAAEIAEMDADTIVADRAEDTDATDDVIASVMDVADMPIVAVGEPVDAEMNDMNEEEGSTMDAQAADTAVDVPDTVVDAPDADIEPAVDDMPETATTASTMTVRGRDPLTGLLDALAFEEVMDQEEAREQRYGHPATIIVFELDGLTKLVDRLGAETGDRIETALGDTIRRLARRADHVARLERGRYAVLLPVTDEVAAINYVERVRRACELWLESGAIAMRPAIGWASTSGDAGLSGAVRVATDRMRQELRRHARQAGHGTPGVESLGAESPDGPEAVDADVAA